MPTLLETAITNRALTREHIVGASVILESALASIVFENLALGSEWWKADGSWNE